MQDIENRIKNLIDSLEFRKKELLNSNKDSDELKDITEYVKFTDEEGNELENMNETVGTAEGKGAGKKFPKTN